MTLFSLALLCILSLSRAAVVDNIEEKDAIEEDLSNFVKNYLKISDEKTIHDEQEDDEDPINEDFEAMLGGHSDCQEDATCDTALVKHKMMELMNIMKIMFSECYDVKPIFAAISRCSIGQKQSDIKQFLKETGSNNIINYLISKAQSFDKARMQSCMAENMGVYKAGRLDLKLILERTQAFVKKPELSAKAEEISRGCFFSSETASSCGNTNQLNNFFTCTKTKFLKACLLSKISLEEGDKIKNYLEDDTLEV